MKIVPVFFTDRRNIIKEAVSAFLPRTVHVPLSQEKGICCSSLVKKGDVVREGQIIAVPSGVSDGKYYAKIHAPVPGTVENIVSCICPDGRHEDAVEISLKGSFTYLGRKHSGDRWQYENASALLAEFAERGIVNTFETNAPVSLAVQISGLDKMKGKILAVRMYDDDPSRITDSLVSSLYSGEIVNGALITAKAMNAKGIVFVSDTHADNPAFPEDAGNIPLRNVKINTAVYPSGCMREIRRAVKKSLKEEPFSGISSDDMYTDASTMFEVSNVIEKGVPVVERFVYVSGDCIPASGLLRVRVGTTMLSLAEQCGGFSTQPAAVIVNGIMAGTSAASLETPVTKYVKSVMFMPKPKVPDQRQSSCVRCGNCRFACPRGITPDVLYRYAAGGKLAERVYIKSAQLCSGCGLCNSVCPARLPLSQAIEMLKKETEMKGIYHVD